jgi:hypothetical protein
MPIISRTVPTGPQWAYEIKHDATMGASRMTPEMRDILSATEGSSDLWLTAHGPHKRDG